MLGWLGSALRCSEEAAAPSGAWRANATAVLVAMGIESHHPYSWLYVLTQHATLGGISLWSDHQVDGCCCPLGMSQGHTGLE